MFLIYGTHACSISIARFMFDLSTDNTQARLRESICFLIAGKVHESSHSRALIEIHCLLNKRYLRISTFVLLPKSFSKFILQAIIVKHVVETRQMWFLQPKPLTISF